MSGKIPKRVQISMIESNQPSLSQVNKSGLTPTIGKSKYLIDLLIARVNK